MFSDEESKERYYIYCFRYSVIVFTDAKDIPAFSHFLFTGAIWKAIVDMLVGELSILSFSNCDHYLLQEVVNAGCS